MALIDKKLADLTARDAINVWSLTAVLDVFKILLAVPFFFREKRPQRTTQEILQAQRDTHLDFVGRD